MTQSSEKLIPYSHKSIVKSPVQKFRSLDALAYKYELSLKYAHHPPNFQVLLITGFHDLFIILLPDALSINHVLPLAPFMCISKVVY